MRVQVVARIQAHPARRHLHEPLAQSLGLPTTVCEHKSDPPSPWGGYRYCLSDIGTCTHLLIIQDDAVVCKNFAAAVRKIAETQMHTPVVLYLGGFPQGTASRAMRAMMRGHRYVAMYPAPIIPAVAVLWPKAKAQEFLAWTESGVRLPGDPEPRADDGIMAKWAKRTKQLFLVAVPSLVQHPDVVPSVKKGPQRAAAGRDTMRISKLVADDGLAYDWSVADVR